MIKNVTNEHGIDLPLAVWLLQDGYKSGADDAPEGELISVTTLLRPTKELILRRMVDQSSETIDIADLVASRMGHSLHDSIERAWTEGNWQAAMRKLHYPQSIIGRIVINPTDEVGQDQIPIYLERRGFRIFQGLVITGQLDFLMGTSYRDFKSTSTFAYTDTSKDQDYILQGSMYRWIMPDLIKDDIMRIEFIFTDWVKYRAKSDPSYPQAKAAHKEYPLMSLAETEQWISDKLDHIRANVGKPQDKMDRCTDKELWKGKDTFKYYSKPETALAGGRCTKRFDSETDAELHRMDKGKGVVVRDSGEVKRCTFCPAFTLCEQRKEYFQDDGSRV